MPASDVDGGQPTAVGIGAPSRSESPRRGTILVAGSDSDLVDLLVFAVKQAGHTPLAAQDPASARRLLATGRPDAAVVDLGSPVGNGRRLLWELRRSRLPVLVVANDRVIDEVASGLCADDYFVKPFSPRALLARLGDRIGVANGDIYSGAGEAPAAAADCSRQLIQWR